MTYPISLAERRAWELEMKLNEANGQMDDMDKEIGELQKEAEDLEEKLNEAYGRIDDMDEEIGELEKEAKDLEEKLELHQDLATTRKRLLEDIERRQYFSFRIPFTGIRFHLSNDNR